MECSQHIMFISHSYTPKFVMRVSLRYLCEPVIY